MGGLLSGLFGGGGGGGEYPAPAPVRSYPVVQAPQPTPVYMDRTDESAMSTAQAEEQQRRLRQLYAFGSESNKVSGAWKKDLGTPGIKTTSTLGG